VTVRSWRIVAAARAAQAFDGEGARINGGRWNPPGAPVVYTAESAALAALEMLAHLRPLAAIPAYVLIPCEFDRRLVERLDRKRLPRDWRAYPAPSALQLLGHQWIKGGVPAVLEVPSALVPTESNYLLNPRHRDFRTIRMGSPRPFELDPRLAG
jgi:RES domain-containing protein